MTRLVTGYLMKPTVPDRTPDSMPLHPLLAPYTDTRNADRVETAKQPDEQAAIGQEAPRGLSIIILNLDKPELIVPLVESLVAVEPSFRAAGLGFEVLVGDTGSTNPKVLALYDRAPPFVKAVRGLKYHFSRSNNQVFFGHARYDTALFLNNDVVIRDHPDCLMGMVRLLDRRPELGMAGLCLFFPDGTVQHAGIDVFRDGPLRGFCFHPHARARMPERAEESWDCLAVTAACVMIRSSLFREIGGFDEAYRTECQDVALCLAAQRLGRGVAILNAGQVLHLENATRPKGSEDWGDRQLFMRRWGSFIEAFAL
ncbi:glycosyltransferase [Azospirillum sp. SYSU D00513]|uniref:glycosyltransferase n=1 Tax=Azospirillum sp. SYSU D00513 TaxID=2812561 RepID=UPI001A96E2B3|nr:glycosyltransferase [Azospirillum sp. SYSU D00513]